MSTSNTSKGRPLTAEEFRSHEQFARLEISLEELRNRVGGDVLEFDFSDPARRTLTSHFGTPEPAVRIEVSHIRNAMDKHARGEITTQELSDWATMLQLNHTYDWEGPDEEEIAGWLDEISLLTLKPEAEPGANPDRF